MRERRVVSSIPVGSLHDLPQAPWLVHPHVGVYFGGRLICVWMQQCSLRSLSLRSVDKKGHVGKLIVVETGIFIFWITEVCWYVQLLNIQWCCMLLCGLPRDGLQLRSLACSLLSFAFSFKEPWIVLWWYSQNICFVPSTLYFNCISFYIFRSIKATRLDDSVLSSGTNELFYSPSLLLYFSCGSMLTNCIKTKFSFCLNCICMCFIAFCILWCTEI